MSYQSLPTTKVKEWATPQEHLAQIEKDLKSYAEGRDYFWDTVVPQMKKEAAKSTAAQLSEAEASRIFWNRVNSHESHRQAVRAQRKALLESNLH